jgi:hypothetical protein
VARGPRARRTAVAIALAWGGCPGVAHAGPQGDAPGAQERLERLERRNAELEARVDSLEGHEAAQAIKELESQDDSSAPGIVGRYGDVFVTFNSFADYGLAWSNPPEPGRNSTAFAFGSLDFFLTARLGDRFHVLSETILEGDADDVGIDAERLYAAWDFSDAARIKLGLEHLPTARWNRLHHHGKWLELSIERPFMARFEDDGGLLPMHYSGAEIGGRVTTCCGALEYAAIVSNGRGADPEDRQRGADENSAKAIDVTIALAPDSCRGLTAGISGRWDVFPADGQARTRGERELAGGFFVQIDRGALASIGEVGFLQHHDRTTDDVFHHVAGYLQAGWRCGDFTPYVRCDVQSMERNDPFFAGDDLDLDRSEATLGVRWDFTDQASLKVELRHGRFQERAPAPSTRTDRDGVTTVALQVAWYL